MYYTKIDLNLDKLEIQKDELTEVKWFSIDELKLMVEQKVLNIDQIEFFEKCMKYLEHC